MVLTSSQMLAAEKAVIAGGVSAEALMEEASEGIFQVIRQFLPGPGTAVLYLGKGNNAGDALVVGRHLLRAGWKVVLRRTCEEREFKELPARHYRSLAAEVTDAAGVDMVARERGHILILDGILGIGASPTPLKGVYADAVREMNALRRQRHAFTVAVDLPTGLGPGHLAVEADHLAVEADHLAVEADLTVTVGFVKSVLLEDGAAAHVGRLAVVPLRALASAEGDVSQRLLTSDVLLPTLPCRCFEFHKGQAGRVGIVAGARGYLGAGVLAASGALRGGAGLVTQYVKEEAYAHAAALAPAEVMVKPVRHFGEVLDDPLDALAVGPGLGREHEEEVLELLERASAPAVVDADALNLLARRGFAALERSRAPRLLTPHPGEMARLSAHFPEWQAKPRREMALKFAARFPQAALLLKGSRTLVAAEGRPLSYNSTGNPGMATGGMGDVLTGLCTALAAQGMALHDAACLGAWLSGRAAERALLGGDASQESLIAGDVLRELGGAFCDLKRLVY